MSLRASEPVVAFLLVNHSITYHLPIYVLITHSSRTQPPTHSLLTWPPDWQIRYQSMLNCYRCLLSSSWWPCSSAATWAIVCSVAHYGIQVIISPGPWSYVTGDYTDQWDDVQSVWVLWSGTAGLERSYTDTWGMFTMEQRQLDCII